MSNAAVNVPKPPRQRVSRVRVSLIIYLAVIAAVALTVFDAKISLDGFRLMSLPQYVPIVLASLIFIVQLNAGAIQQLGMNPFYGVGGSPMLDFIWRWVLAGIYVIDVGSNAIAFRIQQYLTFQALRFDPVGSITMAIVMFVLALLLTFGDELLLRMAERLDQGAKANAAAARKMSIDQTAYNRYLVGYQTKALEQADIAGEHATIDFKWLKENTQ